MQWKAAGMLMYILAYRLCMEHVLTCVDICFIIGLTCIFENCKYTELRIYFYFMFLKTHKYLVALSLNP